MSQLFDLEDAEKRVGTTKALVAIDRDTCPACGEPLKTVTSHQAALLRHGGYGGNHTGHHAPLHGTRVPLASTERADRSESEGDVSVVLVEPQPLFVDSWEFRMKAACVELNRAGTAVEAKYHCTPMKSPTKGEMQRLYDARWDVRQLVREAGE